MIRQEDYLLSLTLQICWDLPRRRLKKELRTVMKVTPVNTVGSPETRVFILVALTRVNVSHWFTRASATRIKTRVSGLPMVNTG